MTAPLVSRDAVESGGGWQAALRTEIHERAVTNDAEHADGARTRIERIQESSVRADRDIEIHGACRVYAYDRAADGLQCAVRTDLEACDRRGTGVRVVDEAAVGRHDVP